MANEMKVEKNSKKRQLRFKPDEGSVAWVDTRRSSSSEEFLKQFPALIVNESFDGCALICSSDGHLKKGSKLWLEVGLLSPMQAEVMWVEKLSQDAVKFGARYL